MAEPALRLHVGSWGPLYLETLEHRSVRELAPVAKVVYFILCAHAGRNKNSVILGIDRLAYLADKSERTVQRHLRTLERAGLVHRCRRMGRAGQDLRSRFDLQEPLCHSLSLLTKKLHTKVVLQLYTSK